jgi:hypothetical protein
MFTFDLLPSGFRSPGFLDINEKADTGMIAHGMLHPKSSAGKPLVS